MAVRTQPTLSPSISARVTEAMALSPSSFHKRYISSYETPSSSASPASSLTLPIRKSEESEEKGPGSESEEAAFEEQQQQSVLVKYTAADEPLGLGYGAARRRVLELEDGPTSSTFKVGQSSRNVPDRQTTDEITTPRLPVRATWEDPVDDTIYTNIECA
ncbi:hypothetical protein Tco_1444611, partial [Tanacetum coccineum]